MGRRLDLHEKLTAIPGVAKVYFQPPKNTVMQYPCIRYSLSDVKTDHAANAPYSHKNRYELIVIDRNPDTLIHVAIGQMPMSAFRRFYEADGLNHFVYEIYF